MHKEYKLKIAIQLCGNLRTFEKTIESFKKAFDGLDIDIFCHTWNTLGHIDNVWWSQDGDGKIKGVDQEVLNKVINFYSPKKILVDRSNSYNPPFVEWSKGYNAVKNQWDSNYRCNELRKQYEKEMNIKYDLVIKTRCDILFEESFKEILNNYTSMKDKNNTLYVLNTPTSKKKSLYNDIMFFGSPSAIDQALGFTQKMEDYLHYAMDIFKVIEGEAPFTYFLKDLKNLEVEKYNLKCKILRLNGKTEPLYE
jgi:hypothetical protein